MARRVRGGGRALRRRRHRRLQRRRSPPARRSRRRRSTEWNRNHAVLGTGLLPRRPRGVPGPARARARGGSIVFVASKNALVAGSNAAAYSSAKAAELHLARCLAEEGGPAGIRVNTVNPDAVLRARGSGTRRWREERAANYGIAPDELEEHYRARTTLGVNIEPEDIAEAVLHFASEARSGKTHGQPAQRRRRRAGRVPALSRRA